MAKRLLVPIARLIVDNCALYLLSVLFLLLGIYAGLDSPLLGGIGTESDFPLLGVMNLYDVALLAVLGWLFARPERREDGYWAAGVAIFLLMDPTFFNNRFYQSGPDAWYGLGVNAALLLVAGAKVMVLTGWCRVPLARSSVLSILATLAFVYLAPAPFALKAFASGPAAFYALGFVVLGLAFLAPVGAELAPEPIDDTERASVRARELRLAALALPFLGVARHYFELGSFYGIQPGLAHAGPWMLAAVVLAARLWPEAVEDLTGVFGLLAAGSLGVALAAPAGLTQDMAAGGLTPLRLTLLAQVLVGSYLALRFRTTAFEVHAATAALLGLSGGTPEQIAHAFAGPWCWAVLTVLAAVRMARGPGYRRGQALVFVTSGLAASAATGAFTSLVHLHLLGLGLCVLMHGYPEESEEDEGAAAGLLLLMLVSAALVPQGPMAGLGWRMVAAGEALVVMVAAAFSGRRRYRAPAWAALTGALVKSPLLPWLAAHKAGVGLGLAFACLGGGAAVSAHKQDLQARLVDEDA